MSGIVKKYTVIAAVFITFQLHAGQPHIGQSAPGIETTPFSMGFNQDSGHKVYIVNFWATWCGPCREELPFFKQLYRY